MADILVTATGRHRRRRECHCSPEKIDVWPTAWRELTSAWVRKGARCKWETLLTSAGGAAFETAHDLLDALLASGWIRLDERWLNGRWQPVWIEFMALPELRQTLGLPEPGARQAALEQARIDLLAALDRWAICLERPQQATRRDFAQFARGDTKGITATEWDWLEARVDLANYGISDHTPLLCLAAPLTLVFAHGSLNLDSAPDFIAITPTTLSTAETAQGKIVMWTLVENRTSFERAARARTEEEGVIWLPGFAPGWWKTAVACLLRHAPAPARIACDPDPAGIEIAINAGLLWQNAGLEWHPWKMNPTDLAQLTKRKPLTEHDRNRLTALLSQPLPALLRVLAETLADGGEKGEQEGYL
ncbi:MAG: hypothetical protein Q8O31_02330 [Rhodocyclaceae bacterium]|nr:hypothetical protein [Rhodocyclaceae bacterium]